MYLRQYFSQYVAHVLVAAQSNKIDESAEVVLIAKTLDSKYQALEDEIHKIHTYETPCVFAIPVTHVAKSITTGSRASWNNTTRPRPTQNRIY